MTQSDMGTHDCIEVEEGELCALGLDYLYSILALKPKREY